MNNMTMAATMTPNSAHKDIPGNPSTATSSAIRLSDRSNGEKLRVLTEEDWRFWIYNGYVIIKNAVPREQVKRTARFLWEFEEKDPHDPGTWYTPPRAEMKMKELTNTGMVEVYNHQLLWDNRQTPKVHAAFADIWGTEKLWCTIDRANLNFPLRPGFEYKGFIHWDYDPETKPQNVQGVLALADQGDWRAAGDDAHAQAAAAFNLNRVCEAWHGLLTADLAPAVPGPILELLGSGWGACNSRSRSARPRRRAAPC